MASRSAEHFFFATICGPGCRRFLRTAARALGKINVSTAITTSSLRRGDSTAAANAGVPKSLRMGHCRWRSQGRANNDEVGTFMMRDSVPLASAFLPHLLPAISTSKAASTDRRSCSAASVATPPMVQFRRWYSSLLSWVSVSFNLHVFGVTCGLRRVSNWCEQRTNFSNAAEFGSSFAPAVFNSSRDMPN
jgi:hypothetical protein